MYLSEVGEILCARQEHKVSVFWTNTEMYVVMY